MLAHPPMNKDATITGRIMIRAADAALGRREFSASVTFDFTAVKRWAVRPEAAMARCAANFQRAIR